MSYRNISCRILVLLVLIACNKPVGSLPANESKDFIVSTKEKINKVLLILVDGAVGQEYKTMALPTLKSLERTSMYSYDGINDIENSVVEQPKAWANIMTGVTKAKHNVTSGFTGNNLSAYPSFINRIKEANSKLKITTIGASIDLSDNLFAAADEKFIYPNNDVLVQTKTLEVLSAATASDVIISHFNSPDRAGSGSDYTATSATYKDTATKLDGYLGQQLKAVKERPNYANENWLVMIVSAVGKNVGDAIVPWNAFLDKNHNTLFFYYNSRFQYKAYEKPTERIPFVGYAPMYTINGSRNNKVAKMAATANTADLNFGTDADFTVQCKVKIAERVKYWPSFLGKRERFDRNKAGWLFFFDDYKWGFNVSGGTGNKQAVSNVRIINGLWHTCTATVQKIGSERILSIYTDGVKDAATAMITNLDLNSTAPLSVGWDPGSDPRGGPRDINIIDIRVYNTALSDAHIAATYCSNEVPSSDPYFVNLIGFWPSTNATFTTTEGKKTYFLPDMSGKGRDLLLGEYVRSDFADSHPTVCPSMTPVIYKQAPNSIDVAQQVMSWLGIVPRVSWDMEGKVWLPNYANTYN